MRCNIDTKINIDEQEALKLINSVNDDVYISNQIEVYAKQLFSDKASEEVMIEQEALSNIKDKLCLWQ